MDNLGLTESIKIRSPNTLICYRAFNSNDPNWQNVLTPQAWFDANKGNALNGQNILVCFNEPSPADRDKFITWCIELLDITDVAKVSLALCNFAVGNPNEKDIEAGLWDKLIIRLSTSLSYLGLHEYFQVNPVSEAPYLCGRFQFWLDRATLLKVNLKVIITEHGRDLGGGVNDGWHGQGWTEPYYFDLLSQAQTLYAPHHISVCIFCYGHGAGGRWNSFDFQSAETLKSLIVNYNKAHPMTQPTIDRSLLGTPVPGIVTSVPQVYVNVRDYPDVNIGKIIGQLHKGDSLVYRPKQYEGGWYALESPLFGWFSNLATIGPAVNNVPLLLMHLPYVSQLGLTANKANNDCLEASFLMEAFYWYTQRGLSLPTYPTVDVLTSLTPLASHDTYLTFQDGIVLAQRFGFTLQVVQGMNTDKIISYLRAGMPPIINVSYKFLNPGVGDFLHFCVATGYNDSYIWVHDPYVGGANLAVPISNMAQALTDVTRLGNIANQGIVLAN